jgi:hypothetical protein
MLGNTLYLLIVGSRSITNYNQVGPVLDDLISGFTCDNYVVVSGGASGVDYLAELWAEKHGFEKIIFKADWKRDGKKAGFIRNEEMHKFISKYKGLVVVFWDGKSKGAAHNFDLAVKYNNSLIKYLVTE